MGIVDGYNDMLDFMPCAHRGGKAIMRRVHREIAGQQSLVAMAGGWSFRIGTSVQSFHIGHNSV